MGYVCKVIGVVGVWGCVCVCVGVCVCVYVCVCTCVCVYREEGRTNAAAKHGPLPLSPVREVAAPSAESRAVTAPSAAATENSVAHSVTISSEMLPRERERAREKKERVLYFTLQYFILPYSPLPTLLYSTLINPFSSVS